LNQTVYWISYQYLQICLMHWFIGYHSIG